MQNVLEEPRVTSSGFDWLTRQIFALLRSDWLTKDVVRRIRKTTDNVFHKYKKSCYSGKASGNKWKGRYKKKASNVVKVMVV